MNRHRHLPLAQRGVVLVTSLLLLIVVTIMALSMFRSFGIQEKIAGTTREKQRALQAAESAQQYAEWWLYTTNATTLPVVCNSLIPTNGTPQICTNALTAISAVPWKNGANDIGANYQPPQMTVGNASVTNWNNYAVVPRFYIADLGLSTDPNIPGEIYQVDAVGYGGSADAVAVVESTFAVYSSSRNTTL